MLAPQSTRRAFSLIEVAIALMLTGLVAGVALTISSTSGNAECYANTKTQMNGIKEAIDRFSLKNERFPMPARRNVGAESPVYGREVPVADIAQLDSVTNSDGSVAVFGALPFQALGIPAENAADCWGNKFTYVVTKELTDKAKFLVASTNGAMDIKTTVGGTPFLAGAGYAIISHGEDQLGAVKNNYATSTNTVADRKWCANNPAANRSENCDISNNVLIDTQFNNGKNAAANYFDDIIAYKGKPWRTPQQQNSIYCWGDNGVGELGDGTLGHRWQPMPVKLPNGVTGWKSLAVSNTSSCAIGNNDRVYCWGFGGGLYPNSATKKEPTDMNMPPIAGVSFDSITRNALGFCVLGSNGKAYCFGTNSSCHPVDPTVPIDMSMVTSPPFTKISSNNFVTYALDSAGNAYYWGTNSGWANCKNIATPIDVSTLPGVRFTSISVNNNTSGMDTFVYATADTGKVYRWGVFGDLEPKLFDTSAITPEAKFIEVKSDSGKSCGLTDDGRLYCWPWGGSIRTFAYPPGVTSFKSIASYSFVNDQHTVCAVGNDEKAYCYGNSNPIIPTPSSGIDNQYPLRVGTDTPAATQGIAYSPAPPAAVKLAQGTFSTIQMADRYSCALMVGTPPTPPPVDGKCDLPKINCEIGEYQHQSGTGCGGTRVWKCLGTPGGATADCQAIEPPCNPPPPTPVNGACGNPILPAFRCAAGNPINADNGGGCGETSTWLCEGLNGGTTSGMCYKNNPPCGGCGTPQPTTCSGTSMTMCDSCGNCTLSANHPSCAAPPPNEPKYCEPMTTAWTVSYDEANEPKPRVCSCSGPTLPRTQEGYYHIVSSTNGNPGTSKWSCDKYFGWLVFLGDYTRAQACWCP